MLRLCSLPISYIPPFGSYFPLSGPLIALSWSFRALFGLFSCILNILHQVVGANIFSVQIILQNDAKAATKIYQNTTPSRWCKYIFRAKFIEYILRANRTAKRC